MILAQDSKRTQQLAYAKYFPRRQQDDDYIVNKIRELLRLDMYVEMVLLVSPTNSVK